MNFTYDTLKQALQDWPVNNDEEYVDNLPLIIQQGEDRLVVDLNLDLFDKVDTATVTIATRNVPRPTGTLSTRDLYLISAGARRHLKKRSYGYCMQYAPTPATTGVPRYWCELDTVNWMLVPTPNAGGQVEAHSVKRPASLTAGAGNGTTWLSQNVGDLLLKACLLEADEYLKADDRWGDIKTSYDSLLAMRRLELRESIRTGQYTPYMPAAQPAGQQQ